MDLDKLISSLGVGIRVGSNNNTIQDNYIGTDISGTAAVGNTRGGIRIGDLIPNPTPIPVTGTIVSRNVISGNTNLVYQEEVEVSLLRGLSQTPKLLATTSVQIQRGQ
jgi:hypothetical protein